MEFDLWELLDEWPDPVIFVDREGRPLGLAVSEDGAPEDEPLPLEPEDLDFYTGMPLSVPYDLSRPD